MRQGCKLVFAGLVGFCSSLPAAATTWFPVKVVCPVGGKSFQSQEMGSNSYFGQRPDGRPYSPSPIPPIDECPDNGFVIFDEKLTREEVTQLTQLVASEEYRAMRAADTRHRRAAWLMGQIARNQYQQTTSMLYATWETDQVHERKGRYQQQFVALAKELQFSETRREAWYWLRVRAANALRELGRFEESDALLDQTDIAERRPTDPEQKPGAIQLVTGLRNLNRDRNSHSEPVNLVPAIVARDRCKDAGLSPTETNVCNSAELKSSLNGGVDRRAVNPDAAAAAAAEAARAAVKAASQAAAISKSRSRAKQN